jgi:hypothetical protein
MSEAVRAFPTEAVLSTITDRLIGDIGGVYEVLNWMTGESVFTHQLPRIGREATPVIVGAHPELQQAVDEAEQVTPENWQEWRDRWIERYGATIDVPRFNIAQHERIDPRSELAEMVHPDKIIEVGT